MPRLIKPNNNATRKMSYGDFETLTKTRPYKKLTTSLKKHGGRDASGSISIRHKGGGAKRLYRTIDFKFLPFDGAATVLTIEYDPNRSAFIGLAQYRDGERRYVLVPQGVKVGESFLT